MNCNHLSVNESEVLGYLKSQV